MQWLAIDTADDSGAWFVERPPDGATWQPGTHRADVTVTGPEQSLLLILTRRLPLTDRDATNISVDGDTDLAQHWIDHTAPAVDRPEVAQRINYLSDVFVRRTGGAGGEPVEADVDVAMCECSLVGGVVRELRSEVRCWIARQVKRSIILRLGWLVPRRE